MKIYILGHRCVKGNLTEELVRNLVAEKQIDATIKRVTRDEEIIKFGISLTPSVMIDDQIRAMGRIPRRDEVLSWLTHVNNSQIKAA